MAEKNMKRYSLVEDLKKIIFKIEQN